MNKCLPNVFYLAATHTHTYYIIHTYILYIYIKFYSRQLYCTFIPGLPYSEISTRSSRQRFLRRPCSCSWRNKGAHFLTDKKGHVKSALGRRHASKAPGIPRPFGAPLRRFSFFSHTGDTSSVAADFSVCTARRRNSATYRG